MDRRETIREIKSALRRRSGHGWSVHGGTGTAYGWISISRHPHESMTDAERAELDALLGMDGRNRRVGGGHSPESIPAGHDYYQEYIDRANGRAPSVTGTPYWD